MKLRRAIALPALASLLGCALLFSGACSGSSSTPGASSGEPGTDGSGPSNGDGGTPTSDARVDSTSDAPATSCEGACKKTGLVADFGGKKRTLDRAQFGTQPGDGGTAYHSESYAGGATACPTMGGPQTDYTLIVTNIPRGALAQKLSDRNGISSTFFDFKNDLGLPALTKAVGVSLTVVAEDPAPSPKWVAFDVVAAFREGEVKGHAYAEYCQSLSE